MGAGNTLGGLWAIASPRPQSGKSTLAELLRNRMGAVRLSFADPLRDEVSGLFLGAPKEWVMQMLKTSGMKDRESADFSIAKVKNSVYHGFLAGLGLDTSEPRSLRWHMQMYGTDYKRVHLNQQNIWRDRALVAATAVRLQGCPVVIDDLRFPNELEAIKAMGGKVIYISTNMGVKDQGATEGLIDWRKADHIVENPEGQNPACMLTSLYEQGFFVGFTGWKENGK